MHLMRVAERFHGLATTPRGRRAPPRSLLLGRRRPSRTPRLCIGPRLAAPRWHPARARGRGGPAQARGGPGRSRDRAPARGRLGPGRRPAATVPRLGCRTTPAAARHARPPRAPGLATLARPTRPPARTPRRRPPGKPGRTRAVTRLLAVRLPAAPAPPTPRAHAGRRQSQSGPPASSPSRPATRRASDRPSIPRAGPPRPAAVDRPGAPLSAAAPLAASAASRSYRQRRACLPALTATWCRTTLARSPGCSRRPGSEWMMRRPVVT
jgi:hypothetical protein